MRNLLIAGIVVLSLVLTVVLGFGPYQDQPPAVAGNLQVDASATAADPRMGAESGSQYTVPAGSPQEILEWMGELATQQPDAETRDERIEQIAAIQKAILQGADAILEEGTGVADELTLGAVRLKFRSLRVLSYLGEKQAAKDLSSFAERLKKDPRRVLAEEGEFQLLAARVDQMGQSNAAQLGALVDDLIRFLKSTGFDRARFAFAIEVARQLENFGQTAPAATLYEELASLVAASGDPRLTPLGEQFKGVARRMRLVGNEMEIAGTAIDGQDFDWAAYRGKVVLVDFWATWCGPCIAELPNVKKNYELYHDRGFDVVGISLDQNRDQLLAFLEEEAIPWVTLVGENAQGSGWSHPVAEYYGVTGIPTVILVDQTGKVVSLNARGRQLGRLLDGLLGPPNQDAAE